LQRNGRYADDFGSGCQFDHGQEQGNTGHLPISARAYDKVLRVVQTLADLDGADGIADKHVSEAVPYRSLEGQFFG